MLSAFTTEGTQILVGNRYNEAALRGVALQVMESIGLNHQESSAAEGLPLPGGVVSLHTQTGLLFLVDARYPLDATSLLVRALRFGITEIVVVVAAIGLPSASLTKKSRLLSFALFDQLSQTSLCSSVYIANSLDSIERIDNTEVTLLASEDPTMYAGRVPSDFGADLTWRFGELYLEYLGIPYAKIEVDTGELKIGVSEPESEILGMTHAHVDAGRKLASLKAQIQLERNSSHFGSVATSLKSRWLASVVVADPGCMGANAAHRLDVYREDFIGIPPFSDLANYRGGFWGLNRDYSDLVLVKNDDNSDKLVGVCGTLDLGCVARTIEVWKKFRTNMNNFTLTFVVPEELARLAIFQELVECVVDDVEVLSVRGSWTESLCLEVVTDGL